MDFEKMIAYLNIQTEHKEKLPEFFEQEDVREFLLLKWQEYVNNLSLEAEDEVVDSDEPNLSNSDNDIHMATIPNIPEDEETKARQTVNPYIDSKDNDLDRKLKAKHIQLQNGKVNQPYQCLFDITVFGIADIGDFELIGLEEIGLKLNPSTNLIEGIPTIAGDHRITLKCKRNEWSEGDPIFERTITLIINPDPRSLWNNIPTPANIEYYKPDSDCKYIKVEKTKGIFGLGKKEQKDIVAASQRGRSHAHEGTPRDDDFSILHQQNEGWYIMTVADGAGSAKYSRHGSFIACQTVSDICNTQFAKYNKEVDQLIKDFEKDSSDVKRKKLGDALYNIIGSAVFKAYKNIEKEAEEKENQIKDYATTLLVTVSKKFKFGWFVAAFWVGDGGIGIYNKDTQYLKIMGEPDGGEFAGQTRFLTMSEIMQPTEIYKRLRFEIVEDFTALILMSDGITDPKFETDSNLNRIEKWNKLWEDITSTVDLTDDNVDSAQQLLQWLDFWSQGNHDDRTIAILY